MTQGISGVMNCYVSFSTHVVIAVAPSTVEISVAEMRFVKQQQNCFGYLSLCMSCNFNHVKASQTPKYF